MKRGRKRALTDEQAAEANVLYNSGLNYTEVANIYYINPGCMRKYIINMRPKKVFFATQESVDELNRLYEEENMTYTQLAKKHECSIATIRSRIINPRQGRPRKGCEQFG